MDSLGLIKSLSDDALRDLVDARFFSRFCDFWVPNGMQANFVRLMGGVRGFEDHSTGWVELPSGGANCFINIFVGGNLGGKSAVGAFIVSKLLGLSSNRYFGEGGVDFPSYRHRRGRGRIISTPTAVKKTIVPMLLEMLPMGSYDAKPAGREYLSEWSTKDGRGFDIMTFGQDLGDFKSVNVNWLWIDEPDIAEDKFFESTARVRQGVDPKIFMTLTPMHEAAFIHDLVIRNNRGWDVGIVYADSEANCIQHGLRGAVEHSAIERMSAGWTDEMREARLHARWMHLSGVVFPQFNRTVHVVDDREIPLEGTVYHTHDPHVKRPPALGWFRVARDGRLYMIREYPEVKFQGNPTGGGAYKGSNIKYYTDLKQTDLVIDDFVKIIKGINEEVGRPQALIIDKRACEQKLSNSGKKLLDEYSARGLYYQPAACADSKGEIESGHARIKQLLRHQNVINGKLGEPVIYPKLYISSRCENTLRAFERYMYKRMPEGTLLSDELVEPQYKDFMDVVRMMCDWNWRYIDKETSSTYRRALSPKYDNEVRGLL